MLEAAEVVSISFKDDNTENLWQIRCKLLSDTNAISDTYAPIVARPINTTFKTPPIKGEVVLLIKGPSNLSSKNLIIPEWYYVNTINVQSSVHHNALPKIGAVEAAANLITGNIQASQAGNPNRNDNTTSNKLGGFEESSDIQPLQPYQGDSLWEGRFGQSIRFGSTIKNDSQKYATETYWQQGEGNIGDPITILRNGQKTQFSVKPNSNQFINENINFDDASIYLTSTQEIGIAKGSADTIALDTLEFTKNKFNGKQAIISSDRIVLNSIGKEILLFAGGGIGLSSLNGISFDSGKGIHFAGSVINLGNSAKEDGEPAVLGDTTQERLDAMADVIAQLADACAALTVGTGTGPSTVPINVADFTKIAKAEVQKLKLKHKDIKSKYVYLKKDPDYTKSLPPDTPKKNR